MTLSHITAHSKRSPLPPLNPYRNVTDPRALAILFEKTEAELQRTQHPDPYRRQSSAPLFPPPTFIPIKSPPSASTRRWRTRTIILTLSFILPASLLRHGHSYSYPDFLGIKHSTSLPGRNQVGTKLACTSFIFIFIFLSSSFPLSASRLCLVDFGWTRLMGCGGWMVDGGWWMVDADGYVFLLFLLVFFSFGSRFYPSYFLEPYGRFPWIMISASGMKSSSPSTTTEYLLRNSVHSTRYTKYLTYPNPSSCCDASSHNSDSVILIASHVLRRREGSRYFGSLDEVISGRDGRALRDRDGGYERRVVSRIERGPALGM